MNARSRTYLIACWVAVALWALLIFAMSAKPAVELGSGFWYDVRTIVNNAICAIVGPVHDPVSPLGHFLEYLVLGGLLAHALANHTNLARSVGLALLLSSCYAVTDELHQIFVPGRYCDPADWMVDTVAALIGAALVAGLAGLASRGAKRKGEKGLP